MKIFYFCMAVMLLSSAKAQVVLKDAFGRDLTGQTITLVDWEGYMANPAIKLTLSVPGGPFPIAVSMQANWAYLYFDMPSTTSGAGPSKGFTLYNSNPVTFYLSVFPDRDTLDETATLRITNNYYPPQDYFIKIIDKDPVATGSPFKVTVDYLEDTAYHFFNTAAKKKAVQDACNDWAYFITNSFDSVKANTEDVYIWNDNLASGHFTTIHKAFKGYYLYAYGRRVDPNISGGSPSLDDFQKVNGVAKELRPSGGYNADPRGNYNSKGWKVTVPDYEWYAATNLKDVPNDLYSIAHHEIGHALCFNPGYGRFQVYKQQGYISDPDVMAYQKDTVFIDGSDHLHKNFIVDRVSLKGCFGSEYANFIPYGRWLITKLDLVVLQSIGYRIRQTSAFLDPTFATNSLPGGSVGAAYSAPMSVKNGIPFYKFIRSAGTLPPGLTINSFTGAITGIPTQAGSYTFTVKVTDYDNVSKTKSFTIVIAPHLQDQDIVKVPSYKSSRASRL